MATQYRMKIHCPMCGHDFVAVLAPRIALAKGQVYEVICPSNASRIRVCLTAEIIESLEPVPAGEYTRSPIRETGVASSKVHRPGCLLLAGLLAAVGVVLGSIILSAEP
jgi:hypothetical protein